jgi:hypothetical protein
MTVIPALMAAVLWEIDMYQAALADPAASLLALLCGALGALVAAGLLHLFQQSYKQAAPATMSPLGVAEGMLHGRCARVLPSGCAVFIEYALPARVAPATLAKVRSLWQPAQEAFDLCDRSFRNDTLTVQVSLAPVEHRLRVRALLHERVAGCGIAQVFHFERDFDPEQLLSGPLMRHFAAAVGVATARVS